MEQLHCKGPVFREGRFSYEYFVSKHLTSTADHAVWPACLTKCRLKIHDHDNTFCCRAFCCVRVQMCLTIRWNCFLQKLYATGCGLGVETKTTGERLCVTAFLVTSVNNLAKQPECFYLALNMRIFHCTASLAFQGDLDIFSKTASKYDACRLLHLPNIRLRFVNDNNASLKMLTMMMNLYCWTC